MPKNLVSVAAPTDRRRRAAGAPWSARATAATAVMSVPTFVAKNESSFQGSGWSGETEPHDDEEQQKHSGHPGHLARFAVSLEEEDAEHVDEKERRP